MRLKRTRDECDCDEYMREKWGFPELWAVCLSPGLQPVQLSKFVTLWYCIESNVAIIASCAWYLTISDQFYSFVHSLWLKYQGTPLKNACPQRGIAYISALWFTHYTADLQYIHLYYCHMYSPRSATHFECFIYHNLDFMMQISFSPASSVTSVTTHKLPPQKCAFKRNRVICCLFCLATLAEQIRTRFGN